MKKVLSIVLVLMMVLAAVACESAPAASTNPPAAQTATEAPKADAPKADAPKADAPTEAPAPAEEPAKEPEYAALGLNIKNKTGVTINEVYIYEKGAEDKGASVVAAGWKDKDADGDNYEKNIYIVRQADADMEVYVVFEDGTNATWEVGKLAMYDKLSFKKGTDVSKWEHEPNDDPADQEAIALKVAVGKTDDNYYPGYIKVAAEIKNKTGKNITGFYLYEEGGDPQAYNNMVEHLYRVNGEKVEAWSSGKAKEGGVYVFDFFIRPEAANYVIDLIYDDGGSLTIPIEDWFKPNGDGHLKNEISIKSPDDPDEVKIEWDDGTDDDYNIPIDERLAMEMNEIGTPADAWYPVYPGTPEVDAEALKAAKLALEAPAAAAAEEPEPEPAPAAEAGAIGLNVKNKTGIAINELYIYPVGEDKGTNLLAAPLPTQDKEKEGNDHETIVVVNADPEKLGAMEVYVVFAEGDPVTWTLANPLKNYDEFSLKKGADPASWEHQEADLEDHEAIDAAIATAAGAPAAAGDAYTALGLKFKNKLGVTINEAYIYPVGEDKGANVLATPLPYSEDGEEVPLYIFREAAKLGAMEVYIVPAEGDPIVWTLPNELGNNYKLTIKDAADQSGWKCEEITKEKDLNMIAEFVAGGVTSDGFNPGN